MKLTEYQTTLMKEIEKYLPSFEDRMWCENYYDEDSLLYDTLSKLFKEGVEVVFEVKVKEYVGINHPEYSETKLNTKSEEV